MRIEIAKLQITRYIHCDTIFFKFCLSFLQFSLKTSPIENVSRNYHIVQPTKLKQFVHILFEMIKQKLLKKNYIFSLIISNISLGNKSRDSVWCFV